MKLPEKTENLKPYVDRAMHDDELRENLKSAFAAAKEIYNELSGGGRAAGAFRLAADEDVQEQIRKAVDELRKASDRIQGKEEHGARNTMLLLAGIAAGALFNPWTGPATRRWVMDRVGMGGGGGSQTGYSSGGNGSVTSSPASSSSSAPAS
jgi:hypothetical protein